MRWPSTLLSQIDKAKNPKDIEREVHKGQLDLLSKINQLAGGEILYITNNGYTERPSDSYDLISVSVGAVQQTVTLSPSSQVQGRLRTYAKSDSGAGEIRLRCQGQDVIYYPGGSASSMYIGRQGQAVSLLAVKGGFLIVSGVVQPVALEPDIGSGKHAHIESLVSNFDPTVTTNFTVTVTNAPSGSGIIAGYAQFRSTTGSGRTMNIKDSSGNVWSSTRAGAVTIPGFLWYEVPIDSSKQFLWNVDNADVDAVSIFMRSYCLGPA